MQGRSSITRRGGRGGNRRMHAICSIAPLERVLACIPASQASVERVFSAADFLADGRPRIAFDKLAREVYIRFNHFGLNA